MNKFIVTNKKSDIKDEKSILMTLRMDQEVQDEYEELATLSGHSRNKLMCMALQYALENLEFIKDDEPIDDNSNDVLR